jgi:transposase
MHQKALLREEGLKQEIKEKDGQIRDQKLQDEQLHIGRR